MVRQPAEKVFWSYIKQLEDHISVISSVLVEKSAELTPTT